MMPRNALPLFVLLGMALPSCGAKQYAAEAITATVVDAQTRKPVEGALVIAHWIATDVIAIAAHEVGTVEILEAITDSAGKFHFDAWGPKDYVGAGMLGASDPDITVFKRGYEPLWVGNGRYETPPSKDASQRKTGAVRSSLWNGETLTLKPFKGSTEQFARLSYGPVVSDLMSLKSPCAWTRIPRAIAYLEEERQAIRKSGGEVSSLRGDLLSNDEYFVKHGCPSPRKVLGEAVK
jgi:hypothetical protein